MMSAAEKAQAFDALIAEICLYGHELFGSSNGRFVLVGWIEGHCDEVDAVSVGAHPDGMREMGQALAYAAEWAADEHNKGGSE